jgi:hypothetical protein
MMRSNTKASINFPLLRAIDFNVVEKERVYWAVNTDTVPDIQDLMELSVHNGCGLLVVMIAALIGGIIIQKALADR